jgi:hypothetical protein
MMCYTSIALQLFVFAIADPLLGLERKTDSLCLPKLELLIFYAIADPFSALTNLVDPSCLLICDRTLAASATQITSGRSVCMGVVVRHC